MDIKETHTLGHSISSHWYYVNKATALAAMLELTKINNILDVGAGSGFFSKKLLCCSSAKSACCVDTSYKSDFDESFNGRPLYFRKSVVSSDADLVLFMDVLEHVDDDVALLSEYISKIKSGSIVLITVPAFQFMWSEHDIFLDHRRRYTLSQIEMVIKNSGLVLEKSCYFFGLVLPIAFATRIFSKLVKRKNEIPRTQLRMHSPIINGLLSFLCKIELPIFLNNRIGGLSAVCLAKKP